MVKMVKICSHVKPKCANCGKNHQAKAFKYLAWLKAETNAWNNKLKKSIAKDKQPALYLAPEEKLELKSIKIDLDISVTLWAKS